MSYNTYWSGSLEAKPPLTPEEVEKLEDWLGHNDNERIITDSDVLEHMVMNGWEWHTPWSPVDSFTDNQKIYPGATYLEIESENGYSGIMGIIIFHLIKQLKGHTVAGSASWDGDESDDLGEIIVKDNKVYICGGSVVYEEPSKETEVIFG